jgi:NAD(P)-dependent dehydrogenase (short-subunit alcohol dehydrogenase family)
LGERVLKGEIPPFAGGGVVLSAAMVTFIKHSRTKDGWNEVYGINVLAQVLLMRELLLKLGDATVVVIASATHGIGDVKYFSAGKPADGAKNKVETFGLGEAMKRYGSSKLLLIMSSYMLQRKLNAVGPGYSMYPSSVKLSNNDLDDGQSYSNRQLGSRWDVS